uniref:Uncharacterized protein n=1 Tax=Romanomermis culicivorax TaxID=13658 RepID=A0A915IUQ5_ROMCU
ILRAINAVYSQLSDFQLSGSQSSTFFFLAHEAIQYIDLLELRNCYMIYSIPTLLSEASFHLFVQTNLTTEDIDDYLKRKWGRNKEVSQVVCELNRQKFEDEIDEISSIASCGRWSDASAVSDFEDIDLNDSNSNPPPPSTTLKVQTSSQFIGEENSALPSNMHRSNLSRLISRSRSPQITVSTISASTPPVAHVSSSLSNVGDSLPVSSAVKKRRHRRYCSNAVMIAPPTSPMGPRPDFGRSTPQFIHSSSDAALTHLERKFSRSNK